MPSGKSLELAEIQPPEPELLCAVCRRPMSSHYAKKMKKGQPVLLKKYAGHYPTTGSSFRRYRPKKGTKKKTLASKAKAPSSYHLSRAVQVIQGGDGD